MDWSAPQRGQPLAILFAMFQGGGNIPLLLPIVRALVARGHRVRVLAGPGVRASRTPISPRFLERIAATGASLVPFEEPDPHPFQDAPPPLGSSAAGLPSSSIRSPRTRALSSGHRRGRRTSRLSSVVPQRTWSPPTTSCSAPSRPRRRPVFRPPHSSTRATIRGPRKAHRRSAPAWRPARGPLGLLREALYNAGSRRIYIRDGSACPQSGSRASLASHRCARHWSNTIERRGCFSLQAAHSTFPSATCRPTCATWGRRSTSSQSLTGYPLGRLRTPARWSSSASAPFPKDRLRSCNGFWPRLPRCRCARW